MTNPIRMLHLPVSTALGGGPRQVYDLVRRLPKAEFEVVVAAPRTGVFFERFRELGLEVVELPFYSLSRLHVLPIVRLIRGLDIQLVHTHGKGAGLHGRLAARWTGIPAIHTFHGIHHAGYPPGARQVYLALERRLSRLSHTIINVSISQEAEGLRLRLFEPRQSLVIVNGIDLEELERVAAQAPLRRESLGLSPDHLVVGCVTRFDPIKRVESLLRAVHGLAGRVPELHCLLVGGGGEEERLRRLVRELGIRDRVIFTGFLESSARIYSAIDLYVATSLKEGLPLALLEAMGAGLPVVATDVPGHSDVVLHDLTGLLVAPDDLQALMTAIASLISDPARRRRLGKAGRERVCASFAIEPMVRKTVEVYRRAVARPRV